MSPVALDYILNHLEVASPPGLRPGGTYREVGGLGTYRWSSAAAENMHFLCPNPVFAFH